MNQDILEYQAALDLADREICEALYASIARDLPAAEGRVWHGHPVWFIAGNPVVGFSRKKAGVELLFWSGQSFAQAGLKPVGNFKAAGVSIATPDAIDSAVLAEWLREAVAIQWDYANLAKKRELVKLTDF